MRTQHAVQPRSGGARAAMVVGLILLLALVGASRSERADAAWYGAVGFCNNSSAAGGNVWLAPGQRCINTYPIRAELMAVTNEVVKAGYNGPANVINACVVGKQWSGGTGGNVYPLACGIAWPGEVVWGQNQNPNTSNSSWPTIINNSNWNVTTWMHGTWWGLYP